MRKKYFGDSYDFVKRSLLQCFIELGHWSAAPMFTEEIEPRDVNEWRMFLGIPLISDAVLTNENRSSYFNSAATAQHLFIDPNTGLRLTDGARDSVNYLFASELISLAEQRPRFLTMVFDQSLGRAAETVRCDEVTEKLRRLHEKGLFGFAYYSHACFLVLSQDETVLNKARGSLNLRNGFT
jgi:hypothetical protein